MGQVCAEAQERLRSPTHQRRCKCMACAAAAGLTASMKKAADAGTHGCGWHQHPAAIVPRVAATACLTQAKANHVCLHACLLLTSKACQSTHSLAPLSPPPPAPYTLPCTSPSPSSAQHFNPTHTPHTSHVRPLLPAPLLTPCTSYPPLTGWWRRRRWRRWLGPRCQEPAAQPLLYGPLLCCHHLWGGQLQGRR